MRRHPPFPHADSELAGVSPAVSAQSWKKESAQTPRRHPWSTKMLDLGQFDLGQSRPIRLRSTLGGPKILHNSGSLTLNPKPKAERLKILNPKPLNPEPSNPKPLNPTLDKDPKTQRPKDLNRHLRSFSRPSNQTSSALEGRVCVKVSRAFGRTPSHKHGPYCFFAHHGGQEGGRILA